MRADKAPNLKSQFINNVGTIEVVVLRCQADTSDAPPRLLGQATDTSTTPTKKSKKHKRTESVRDQASELGGMFGLFDGACDTMNLGGAGDAQGTARGGGDRPETPGESAWEPVMSEYNPTSPHGGHGGIDLSPVVLKKGKTPQAGLQQFDGYGADCLAIAQEQDANQHANVQAAPPNSTVQLAKLLERLSAMLAGLPQYPAGLPGAFMFEQDIREYRRVLADMQKRQPNLYAAQAQNMPQVGALVAQLAAMRDAIQPNVVQAVANKPMQPGPILQAAAKPAPKRCYYDPKDYAEVKELFELLADDLLREFTAQPKRDFLGNIEKQTKLDVDSELPFRLKECLKDVNIMKRCVEIISHRRFNLLFPHLRKTLGEMQCEMLNDRDLRQPIWNTVESIEAYLKDIESRREGLQNFATTLNEEAMKILDRESHPKDLTERLHELDREVELFQHQIKSIRMRGHNPNARIVHFPLVNLFAQKRGNFDDINPHAYDEHAYDSASPRAKNPKPRVVNNMGRQESGRADGAYDQRRVVNNAGWQEVGQGVANAGPQYQTVRPIPGAFNPVEVGVHDLPPNMNIRPAAYGAQQPYQMRQHAQAVPPGGWGAMKQTPYGNAQFAPGGQYQGVQQQNMGGYGYAQFQGGPQQNPGFVGYAPVGGILQPANRFPGNMGARHDPDEGMLNKHAPANKGMSAMYMKGPAGVWRDSGRKDDGGERPRPKDNEEQKGSGSAYTFAAFRNPHFKLYSDAGDDDKEEDKKVKSKKSDKSPPGWGAAAGNANKDGGWEKKKDNDGWEQEKKKKKNDGWASEPADAWGNNDAGKNDGGGWGQDNAGGSAKKSDGGWGNNNTATKASSKTSEKSGSAGGWSRPDERDDRPRRGTPNTDPKTHVKPYWKDWNKPPHDDDAYVKKSNEPRDAYKYPALPRPAVPDNKAKDRDHGIQAGKGADYAHKCRQPIYIDSMEKPYAAFTFKYRSKGAVEKILDIKIDDMDLKKMKYQVEYDKLMHQPKNKLVEDLARMRMGSGRQTSVAPSNDGSPHNGNWGGCSNQSSSQRGGWGDNDQGSNNGSDNTPTKKQASKQGWGNSAQNKAAPNNDWNKQACGGWGDGANNAGECGDNDAKWDGDNNKNDAADVKPAKKYNPWAGDKFKEASKAEVAKSHEHFKDQGGLQDARKFNEQKPAKFGDDPADKVFWG